MFVALDKLSRVIAEFEKIDDLREHLMRKYIIGRHYVDSKAPEWPILRISKNGVQTYMGIQTGAYWLSAQNKASWINPDGSLGSSAYCKRK